MFCASVGYKVRCVTGSEGMALELLALELHLVLLGSLFVLGQDV